MSKNCVLLVERDPSVSPIPYTVLLPPKVVGELNLKVAELVQIRGLCEKSTICYPLRSTDCPDGKILLSKIIRQNLGVRLGDTVQVESCQNPQTVSRVIINLKQTDLKEYLDVEFCDKIVKQYLKGKRHPVHEENSFVIYCTKGALEFIVSSITISSKLKVQPKYGIITTEFTDILFLSEMKKYKPGERPITDVSYENIGGLNRQINELRQIEFPLRFPKLFTALEIKPPRALFYGPKGVGKVLLARAFANENGAKFIYFDNSIIFVKSENSVEDIIKAKFEEAKLNVPCILCINELEKLTSKRASLKLIAKELLNRMRDLEKHSGVLLIGVTSYLQDVEPAIVDRFTTNKYDKQIIFELPDVVERSHILSIHIINMVIKECNTLYIAEMTMNYTAADLAKLCRFVIKRDDPKNSKLFTNPLCTKDFIDIIFNDDSSDDSY